MNNDHNQEPSFGSTIKVVTSDRKDAYLYDASGIKQKQTKRNGESLTVFEVKQINDKTFYRVGDQKSWLLKNDTNYGTVLSQNDETTGQKDADKYNLSVKNGLVLEHGSSIPGSKGMHKVFKNSKDFPGNTKYEWVYPPDTSQNKYTNAKIKVIFPDGSFKERKVHYLISHSQSPEQSKKDVSNVVPHLTPADPHPSEQNASGIRNLTLKDFNFDFLKNNIVVGDALSKNVKQAVELYEHGFYSQMANTIRKGLESFTDQLLNLNQINPGENWNSANLNNKLGYIAHLRLLPKRMMDLCFSIKNYGNIGSHNSKAIFNHTSALANLKQYHDLLVYLTNTYQDEKWPYVDLQITDDQAKHPNWYKKSQLNPIGVSTYKEYVEDKERPVRQPTRPVQVVATPPSPEVQKNISQLKKKTGQGMKILISCFAAIGVIVLAGIGYEVYQMMNPNNSPQSQVTTKQPKTLKEKAAVLSTKQLIALSLIYADRNDDSKLDSNWQNIYDAVSNNNYNIGRYDSYTFGDATVTAQGKNYIYLFEKGVGIGYQDKGSQRLVSFFDANESEPVRAYDYQMLEVVNSMKKINSLAKKLVFTDESES
ncbi:Rib/alpha-like domain-containing protein [Lactobacillus kefiranofaciens]|uniref:Rib/alpha-like domain-containing protein n=1 Tax=Lactobacillus kefiranofaciens TaxID=267818 RepID=UPI0024694B29|nr:Rib/alpha-like domain-containing protein [Lactobacillus kefiranofaciens]MDH5100042.1 Rib/alpha-like domain-containing protein [Lactobacillus kefiranofaciens]